MPADVEDFTFDENPWAWADYVDDEIKRVDVSAARVTARARHAGRGALAAGDPGRVGQAGSAPHTTHRYRQRKHRCDTSIVG